MKAQCAVIVPDGVAAGGSFVVDLFDGSQIKVTIPAGKQPGDVIIIGATQGGRQHNGRLLHSMLSRLQHSMVKGRFRVSPR